MPRLQETLLHFIWQHKLLKPVPFYTHSGYLVSIIRPGELNRDAGPDFFNASIRINNVVLAGNVEIHVKSSDWLKHQHVGNSSYDKLILHAVYEHDTELEQNSDNNVEVLELKDLIAPETLEKYSELFGNRNELACQKQLDQVNEFSFNAWIERMWVERLENKVKYIDGLFTSFNNDHTQTFYCLLFRSFGFKVNAVPFELAAKHLPVIILLRHADNLMQLEALLLGICGFLDEQFEGPYIRSLQNEFEYLKTKYQLMPLKKELFKFAKLRPANFPTLRLAQLATLLHQKRGLFLSPYLYTDPELLKKELKVKTGGYWQEHFRPDGNVHNKSVSLGNDSVEKIIINTFAPFLFFYAKKTGKPEYVETALLFLEHCRFEHNRKTKLYQTKKGHLKSAAHSQGLINLYDNYCRTRQCLKCGVAAAILKPQN